MEHLVYCDKKANVLTKILNNEKTMIVRGAAGRKLPYGRVFAGETLYFVENDGSGIIKAKATVKNVINSEKMDFDTSCHMIDSFQDKLRLAPHQYKRWAGKKILCLIEIESAQTIEEIVYDRKKNMDDWITVEDIHSILVGSEAVYKSVRIK